MFIQAIELDNFIHTHKTDTAQGSSRYSSMALITRALRAPILINEVSCEASLNLVEFLRFKLLTISDHEATAAPLPPPAEHPEHHATWTEMLHTCKALALGRCKLSYF